MIPEWKNDTRRLFLLARLLWGLVKGLDDFELGALKSIFEQEEECRLNQE